MTRLIIATSSDGTLAACDARCYNSKGNTCHCICAGLNHGHGINLALTYVEHLNRLIARQIKLNHPKVVKIEFYYPNITLCFHAPQPNPHALPRSSPLDQ